MLKIGVPPGAEFALMFVFTAVIYTAIKPFGPEAQAGYGIGSRLMQSLFLPAMAVAFSAAPMAGQNMGAGHLDRVRDTFTWAAIMGSIPMLLLTLLCQWRPDMLVRGFTQEAAVLAVATQFLSTISWNFVASGLLFTCGGMFQALGNTVPSLIASGTRLLTFAVPVWWLSHRAGFEIKQVWYLSVLTMTLQAGFALWLLRSELQRKELTMASARLAA
jgi:Na+-driven multidrug efflux pump